MGQVFSFPNPINEKAARFVAFVVMIAAIVALLTGWQWLLIPLAYGFVARAAAGPTFSPLGRLAMDVVAPRFLGEKRPTPGPPKRFAQAIGAVVTTAAAIGGLALGWTAFANVCLGLMVVFAGLESLAGICVGCRMFAVLMRMGVIPPETCEACNDIWSRPGVTKPGAAA
ncbi:DUF4395 domain-containing protein [Patulibacter sp.]|uniref:DUF4395 domain-containing protein n=1 Tax=Patulibacter sp. TaxID=1912859 RepID=UPI00271DE4DC|nr:DUF4395 domain-containing protein [Patulibacter sp.]MDO9408825.1 DUF4395 domain-containing protein [Patulibacter sp.]